MRPLIRLFLLVFLAGLPFGATQAQDISGLSATDTTASTVTLDWDEYDSSGSDIAGYNVYRRLPEGRYQSPIDYVGTQDRDKGTLYTDSKLRKGQTYYYQIRARTLNGEEVASSREIEVTTRESSEGTHSYGNLKVAVVIYKNANHRDGGDYVTPDRRVQDIKFYLEKARDFFWRNSNMKLNLQLTYYTIDEFKDFGNAGSFESMRITADHLENDYGVASTQYDFIFRIAPSIGGFWSFGVKDLRFSQGPGRRMGFSHLQWPMNRIRGYQKYPAEFDDQVSKETNQLIWLFIHEAQHTIDSIYKFNGRDEMGHGDHPEAYTSTNPDYPQLPDSLRFGERFDFQATLLRTFDPDDFESFKQLRGDWGDVYVSEDRDGDGFPDRDSRVALDEQEFGSEATTADTDGDGLTDKEEATEGIYFYSGSEPTDTDTDGDGTIDGKDTAPRYDVSTSIPKAAGLKPVVDGELGEWNENTIISEGVSYTTPSVGSGFNPSLHAVHVRDSLYIALDVPAYAVPKLRFDLDAQGHWFGSGNTEVDVDVQNQGLQRIRTHDASTRARQFEQQVLNPDNDINSPDGVWDTNPRYKDEFGRIFSRSDIRFELRREGGRIKLEMAIPEREKLGIDYGTGSKVGLRVGYSNVRNEKDGFASTFDKWSFQYYKLGETKAAPYESAETTKLLKSAPNPFRTSMTVRYQMKKREEVFIGVYDILGRRVRTLVDREVRAGKNLRATWSNPSVASGIYFVKLRTDSGRKDAIKVVYIK